MGAVLKQNIIESFGPKLSTFSFNDVQAEADEIIRKACDQLDEARKQASDILEQAKVQAIALRDQAQKEGFETGKVEGLEQGKKDGFEKGLEDAREEFSNKNQEVRKNLCNLLETFNNEHHHLIAQGHQEILALALAIASRIVHKTIELDPSVVLENAKTAVNLVGGRSKAVLKMHPDDIDRLNLLDKETAGKLFNLDQIVIVKDPSVEISGCIVETENGKIDAEISTQIDSMIHQLAPTMTQTIKAWHGENKS